MVMAVVPPEEKEEPAACRTTAAGRLMVPLGVDSWMVWPLPDFGVLTIWKPAAAAAATGSV